MQQMMTNHVIICDETKKQLLEYLSNHLGKTKEENFEIGETIYVVCLSFECHYFSLHS